MLTITHVEPGGHQSVRQVKWVSYDPIADEVTAGMAVMGERNEDGETNHVFGGGGTVYVMNENGKTVAKYDLGGTRTSAQILSGKRGVKVQNTPLDQLPTHARDMLGVR